MIIDIIHHTDYECEYSHSPSQSKSRSRCRKPSRNGTLGVSTSLSALISNRASSPCRGTRREVDGFKEVPGNMLVTYGENAGIRHLVRACDPATE